MDGQGPEGGREVGVSIIGPPVGEAAVPTGIK